MSRTSFFSVLLGTASVIFIASHDAAAAADNVTATSPHVGEVKALILNPQNASELGQLRQQGWVPATGQLVSIREYPALYRTIGRHWTSRRVSSDKFVLPDLEPADEQRNAATNPEGV